MLDLRCAVLAALVDSLLFLAQRAFDRLGPGISGVVCSLCFSGEEILNTVTTGYLSFGHMAQYVVHALEGLACRARVTPASSPAAPASSAQRSRRLRSTLAATPVLLAHAEVTKNIIFFQWVQT